MDKTNETRALTCSRQTLRRLVGARAALLPSLLSLVGQSVHDFQEAGGVGARRGVAGVVGLNHSHLDAGAGARAALGLLSSAGRLLTLQLALGTSTVGGLDALVLARGGFAHRRALGFGGLAGSVALGWLANVFASRAASQFAEILGASQGALGLGAVNGALGAGNLLTSHLALGLLADWVADCGARGIITLPFALGVAGGLS